MPLCETRVKLAHQERACTVLPWMNGSIGPAVGQMHHDPGLTTLRVEQRGRVGKKAWIQQVLHPEEMRGGNLEWV